MANLHANYLVDEQQTAAVLDNNPKQGEIWAKSNPLGRLGQVHELRGVVYVKMNGSSSLKSD